MGVMSTLGVSRNVALAALAHVEYGHRSETRDGDATTLGYAIGADFDHLR
jgi:hypothetical protein